jgi:transketolase
MDRISTSDIILEKDILQKAAKIQYLAQLCRIEVFDIIHKLGNGHWGGSASVAEILATLYFQMMTVNPEQPCRDNRDRLVVSKGHAAPMLYSILAHRGFFPVEELQSLRKLGSRLQGHPCMNQTPGIEMSTGALGHGISVALGMALSSKILNHKYWSFVIVGDGCLNEGQSWEAIMSTAKFKPSRFAILVDYNKVQLDGPCDEIMPLDPLIEKFKAFRVNVCATVFDGHNVDEILRSWEWMQNHQIEPMVVIFKTHKGKGVSFMEDNHKWHGAPIDNEAYDKGRKELINRLQELEALL